MAPACDIAVRVGFQGLPRAGQADRPHVAGFVDVLAELHDADVIVHHGAAVARVQHDGLDQARLHERRRLV